MNSLQQYELYFTAQLTKIYDREETKSLFFLALEEVTGINRMQYTVQNDYVVAEEQKIQLDRILHELLRRKPIQHILKKADFYGEVFEVNEFVLIPRPETEELVHLIIGHHRSSVVPLKIIDIGTGSGCIPVILKKHMPSAHVSALDISKEAIAVARRNAKKMETDIHFVNADILEWEYLFTEQFYDIIVSNPPYITPKEKEEMHSNVLEFEPHLALFVEESAPLLFYETIASFALVHLKPAGDLYFEINQYYGPETADMLRKKGFSKVELIKDMHGADRMIHARR
ncbi:Release factor glutamine methyltransferase [Sphingobacterium spiritivorum]|uniref:peptide chain release factor N(5)-glutamine methyltransferase n=1 Tax=Sphingobacterium spiritivorum TaxID=258 RepID=A0A380BJ55_SPHSI|nr:peptide chain release factor N(5)-glutamine methyltransferase [Sphingobacterium spiritivorum]SUJ01286.1 Release factor glutamine methyltransferase [Sphingobacterium spiritivorum]